MNVIKYKTNEFELEITVDANGISSIRQGCTCPRLSEIKDYTPYLAVISLALSQSGIGETHDEESDIITLKSEPNSPWSNKVLGMKRIRK